MHERAATPSAQGDSGPAKHPSGRARLVGLPAPARPSRRLEALLFTPTLDALLLAQDLRAALEAARAENARLERELRELVRRASHLIFVGTPRGYELRELGGPAPAAGERVEGLVVLKVAASPLPGDRRRCAYLSSA